MIPKKLLEAIESNQERIRCVVDQATRSASALVAALDAIAAMPEPAKSKAAAAMVDQISRNDRAIDDWSKSWSGLMEVVQKTPPKTLLN